MIVPDHWAEARREQRHAGKQVTVQRYGWSDASAADAQAMADARADEALQRILAGERLDRRERKVPYNGSDGIPIREEVLARHGDDVITRNAYGAHCLNSPYALFADVDFAHAGRGKLTVMAFGSLALAAVGAGTAFRSWGVLIGALVVSVMTTAPLAKLLGRLAVATRGTAARQARERIVAFVSRRPSWNVRLYRTPAGYRALATHQPFEARADDAQAFFAALRTDPLYVRMCTNQNCFRARLTAKPWRIGIQDHMRPRPGVWPIRPEAVPARDQWVATYEAKAAGFAACRYVESIGSGTVHESLQAVVDLHDRESRALSHGLPLA